MVTALNLLTQQSLSNRPGAHLPAPSGRDAGGVGSGPHHPGYPVYPALIGPEPGAGPGGGRQDGQPGRDRQPRRPAGAPGLRHYRRGLQALSGILQPGGRPRRQALPGQHRRPGQPQDHQPGTPGHGAPGPPAPGPGRCHRPGGPGPAHPLAGGALQRRGGGHRILFCRPVCHPPERRRRLFARALQGDRGQQVYLPGHFLLEIPAIFRQRPPHGRGRPGHGPGPGQRRHVFPGPPRPPGRHRA